jgi:hypothetical protein
LREHAAPIGVGGADAWVVVEIERAQVGERLQRADIALVERPIADDERRRAPAADQREVPAGIG